MTDIIRYPQIDRYIRYHPKMLLTALASQECGDLGTNQHNLCLRVLLVSLCEPYVASGIKCHSRAHCVLEFV